MVRHFIFLSWSGPGVKSRTLTWNTKGSFTSSALSKTNLSGYWEITQTQKAYKFWSTVIGHQLFPFPPLPAPGKLLGDTFQLLCQHTFIYEKKDKTYPASEGYIFVVLAGVRKVVTFARQLRRRENVQSLFHFRILFFRSRRGVGRILPNFPNPPSSLQRSKPVSGVLINCFWPTKAHCVRIWLAWRQDEVKSLFSTIQIAICGLI